MIKERERFCDTHRDRRLYAITFDKWAGKGPPQTFSVVVENGLIVGSTKRGWKGWDFSTMRTLLANRGDLEVLEV